MLHFKASKVAMLTAVSLLGAGATRPAHATTRQWVFNYTGAEETFVAPTTGIYDITAYGAQGGGVPSPWPVYSLVGGAGEEIGGDVTLTKGETLTILVGGIGDDPGQWGGGGGGGGSFVTFGSRPGKRPMRGAREAIAMSVSMPAMSWPIWSATAVSMVRRTDGTVRRPATCAGRTRGDDIERGRKLR